MTANTRATHSIIEPNLPNTLQVNFTLTSSQQITYLDIDTRIPAKGVTAIYGHSGSGKTLSLIHI